MTVSAEVPAESGVCVCHFQSQGMMEAPFFLRLELASNLARSRASNHHSALPR
jgi:hypothetical protein